RDGADRIDAQAQESGAGAVALAARIRRVSPPTLHAVRIVDGTHAAVRNRATHSSDDRGPSRMTEYSAKSRWRLAGAALLLVAQWCGAQQPSDDVSSLLLGQDVPGGAGAARSQAEALRSGRQELEALPLESERPSMDAAELLGTA